MAKRIIWAKDAIADRLSILDYWYKKTGSKRYSTRLDSDVRQLTKLLALFPEIGRKFEDRSERFFVIDNHILVYQLNDNSVEVLHLWDARRNPEDLKFD